MVRRRLTLSIVLALGGGLATGCAAPSGPRPASNDAAVGQGSGMALRSSAFEDGGEIPLRFATKQAGGGNLSVPLEWGEPPAGTASFAVEVVDTSPVANEWVHWLVVDLPPDTRSLPEGASARSMPSGARELVNGFGRTAWGGPQPPRGSGRHDYRIRLLALDISQVGLPRDASLTQFRQAIETHVLGTGTLMGNYERR